MEDKVPVKQQKTPHRWKKGESGNPKGRPRKPEIELLREALEKAKNKYGKEFLEHFVDLAYKNDNVAVALARKLLPDMTNPLIDQSQYINLNLIANLHQSAKEYLNGNRNKSSSGLRIA